jgi:uncharacterized membrane protein YdfJ with MMPL/SSD domain
MPAENLTAQIGRRSAQHRRKAIIGWLAFVIGVTAIGMTVGTNTLEEPTGNGASRVADQAIDRAGSREGASEQVLVQARRGEKVTGPAFAAAVADTVRSTCAARWRNATPAARRAGPRRAASPGSPTAATATTTTPAS